MVTELQRVTVTEKLIFYLRFRQFLVKKSDISPRNLARTLYGIVGGVNQCFFCGETIGYRVTMGYVTYLTVVLFLFLAGELYLRSWHVQVNIFLTRPAPGYRGSDRSHFTYT